MKLKHGTGNRLLKFLRRKTITSHSVEMYNLFEIISNFQNSF